MRDALATLADVAPDARVINLETSVTRSDDVARGKAVQYRMSPANVECLRVAKAVNDCPGAPGAVPVSSRCTRRPLG